MKKALLGTSALVGAGLLAFSPAPASANDLTLSTSGYLNIGAFIIDGDEFVSARTAAVVAIPTWGGTPNMVPANAPDDGTAIAGCVSAVGAITAPAYDATTNQPVACGPMLSRIILPVRPRATAPTMYEIAPRAATDAVEATETKVEPGDFSVSDGIGRIIFDADGVLDSGLKVGSRVRLEATSQSNAANAVDEHYIWVSGGFGRFIAGAKDSAGYQMHYTAPWFTNNGVDSPNWRNAARDGGAANTYVGMTGDSYKLTYFTPRFGGVQLGVSYAPDGDDRGTKSYNSVHDNRKVNLQDVYSFGANYVSEVSDVSVGVSGAFESGTARAKDPDGSATKPAAGALGKGEDPANWAVGLSLGMSGFTVGGAYKVTENDGNVKDVESTVWSAGVKYAEGPWSVGIGYITSEQDVPTTGAGTLDEVLKHTNEGSFLLLNAGYGLGAGVNLAADVQVVEDTQPTAATKDVETTSIGLTLGVSF